MFDQESKQNSNWILVTNVDLAELLKNTEARNCKIYLFNRIISYKQITFIRAVMNKFSVIRSLGRLMYVTYSPLEIVIDSSRQFPVLHLHKYQSVSQGFKIRLTLS